MKQIKLVFYGIQQFQIAQHKIKHFLSKLHIPDAFFIEVAINEAVNNAIKHGYNYAPNGKVIVTMRMNQKRLFIRIKHNGKGFSGNKRILTINDSSSMLLHEGVWRDCGRGLKLMVLAMDCVVYNEEGNDLLLVKSILASEGSAVYNEKNVMQLL